nr:MAG TPA: hypothetical protein [Caudoviricetes sp.]
MVYNIHRDILSVSFPFWNCPQSIELWGLFRYLVYHPGVGRYT